MECLVFSLRMQVVGLEGQVSCLSDYLLVCSKLRGLYWGAEIRILAWQEDVFCLLKETLIFNGSLVVSDQQWQWWHWQGRTVKICTAVHIMPSLRKLYRVHTVYTHSLYLYLPQSPPIWPGFTSNYAKSPALRTESEEEYTIRIQWIFCSNCVRRAFC